MQNLLAIFSMSAKDTKFCRFSLFFFQDSFMMNNNETRCHSFRQEESQADEMGYSVYEMNEMKNELDSPAFFHVKQPLPLVFFSKTNRHDKKKGGRKTR